MIITRLTGGLGNQMFQYALGRNLALKHNTDMKMDLSFLLDRTPRKNMVYRNYDLDIYNIQENFANIDEIKKFVLLPQKNKYIFYLKNKIHKPHKNVYRDKHFHFDKTIFDIPNNSYVYGSFQCERYFIEIEDLIRKEFSFKHTLNAKIQTLKNKIQSVNSVCVNVRRADFVSSSTANQFHGVCDLNYFSKAIDYITSKISNPYFFIFSDDIEWCKTNFNLKYPFLVVNHDFAGSKFETYLELMTACRHFIIPNSTFGWWAAWLSQQNDKIVIAPKKWFNDPNHKTDDVIPASWLKM